MGIESNQGVSDCGTDLRKNYIPFADDFGPVNLGIVHRFCVALSKYLTRDFGCVLVYCFDDTYQDEANASFLLGSLLALCMGWTPEQAGGPLMSPWSPFKLRSFRDATFAPQPHARTPTSPRPATPEGSPAGVGRAGARITTAGAPPH